MSPFWSACPRTWYEAFVMAWASSTSDLHSNVRTRMLHDGKRKCYKIQLKLIYAHDERGRNTVSWRLALGPHDEALTEYSTTQSFDFRVLLKTTSSTLQSWMKGDELSIIADQEAPGEELLFSVILFKIQLRLCNASMQNNSEKWW